MLGERHQIGRENLLIACQQWNLFDNACCRDKFIGRIRTEIQLGADTGDFEANGKDCKLGDDIQ